ncbi:MAG: hypothetical protein K6U07_10280, partial [Firmicutes bacterium]|nr:hypothetical protein [Bacillota bacterium]
MARIIDLEAWRRERRLVAREVPDEVPQQPLRRLEQAIHRLDAAVARGTGRLAARVERELLV